MVRWKKTAGTVSVLSVPTPGLVFTMWDTQKGSTLSGADSGPYSWATQKMSTKEYLKIPHHEPRLLQN